MKYSAPIYKTEEKLPVHPHRITDLDSLWTFMLAGNATLTLKSVKTENRFTFRVKLAPEPEEGATPGPVSHFVALMNGPDNETNFQYLGHIYRDNYLYVHGRKSKIGTDAPSAGAFLWFYNQVQDHKRIPDSVEVWHEGRCGRCNRKLTVPDSIERGIGPECAKYSVDTPMRPRLQRTEES